MNRPIGRFRWLATAGLALTAIGYGWDSAWHRRNVDNSPHSAEEVVEAHSLLLLGVAVMVTCLTLVVRTTPTRHRFVADWLALLGATSMAVGFGWDSARHIQGTESPTGHLLIYWGAPLVVIGLPVAVWLAYRMSTPSVAGGRTERQVDA